MVGSDIGYLIGAVLGIVIFYSVRGVILSTLFYIEEIKKEEEKGHGHSVDYKVKEVFKR